MNIDENELLIAIQKSISNSEDLISDAKLLLKNDRVPRAYTLYQLAMEELGKAMEIYANIILGSLNTENGRKKFIKNFKDHVEKAQRARMLGLIYVLEIAKKDVELGEKLLEWTIYEIKQASLLNDYKNYSLYTSYIDNTYKSPKEIITRERVNYIELMANARFKITKKFLEISLKNLEEVKEYSLKNPISEEKVNEAIKNFFDENESTDLLMRVIKKIP